MTHAVPSRRQFLQASLAGAGIAALTQPSVQADDKPLAHTPFKSGNVILFQGDSITDAGRNREKASVANEQPGMGGGYAWMAAADILVMQPDVKIYNRGISGNKVFQLAERWKADCLDLKPDVLSILIGVNDIWHKLNGNYDGTVETYEKDLKKLLTTTKEALPDVKLVICEPFVLRCGAVGDKWFPEFDEFRAASKRVSDEFKTIFVPFQSMFNAAVKFAPPEHWAKDGVHPSAHGAALMAHTWVSTVAHSMA
jgi:lysophospholipase L1-like esterase